MTPARLESFPQGGSAAVFGAHGGIGSAVVEAIRSSGRFATVFAYARGGEPAFDLAREATIRAAAEQIGAGPPLRLAIVATGVLHNQGLKPEKALRDLDGAVLQEVFAINAFGPALLMKHILPLMAPTGKAAFVALSARVGSIGDNQAGGWYAYRASKAALNQIVRTASIELRRRRPEALCVSLHPGTVDTDLSRPFSKTGLAVTTPDAAADNILDVVERLAAPDSGGFFDYAGRPIPW